MENETNYLLDAVFGDQPDVRGPLLKDDAEEDSDPIGSFLKTQQLDHLAKNLPRLPITVRIPSVNEILGDSDITTDADVLVKHVEVEPEEMTLAKRARASSSPSKIRLEKTMIDNEVWVIGYDHEGVEVYSRLYAEEVEA